MTGPKTPMSFAADVLNFASDGRTFQRFNVVSFLPTQYDSDGWTNQKGKAEEWLDVMVGAGVLTKTGHTYQIKRNA